MFHLWVPFWNYWAQQTSYTVILCTTKILFFFLISSRAICRVTLLKLLELLAIFMLYGPLQKNTFPPTILEMYVSMLALTETCFEVNTLGEFAPDRWVCSVCEGTEGGVCTCCPCNVILARLHWVHNCRCLVYQMGTLSLVVPLVLTHRSRLCAGTRFYLLPSSSHIQHSTLQNNYILTLYAFKKHTDIQYIPPHVTWSPKRYMNQK